MVVRIFAGPQVDMSCNRLSLYDPLNLQTTIKAAKIAHGWNSIHHLCLFAGYLYIH